MVPSPPHRVAVAGMCPEHWMQLQSRKSRKAGRGVNTLPWTPSLVWQVRQMKPCPTPKQEIPWLEGNPCQGRAAPGNTLPVVFRSQPHGRSSTKCLPGAGCQNSSWATPPAGASAPSHTSSHQPLKGCERSGGYVASRIKALSLPSCPAAWGRGCLDILFSVHLVQATEKSTPPQQPLMTVNAEGSPGSEA